MNSQTVAVLGVALALAAIVLAYLGRDTRSVEGVSDPAGAGAGSTRASDAPAAKAPTTATSAANTAPAQQSALDRGIAERKARDDAACQRGDAPACTNLRATIRARQDYAACAGDDADACRRVIIGLRTADPRQEMHDRCEGGDTRACVLLSNFHLNIDADVRRVAEYQALALAQLKADPRPERREAAAAIDVEVRALGSTVTN
jgi:hypothetical protein